jgi:hypothetical protein
MIAVPHGLRLTRVPRWDERNLDYKVAESAISPMKTHHRYVWLNQGDTPACTGFSGAQMLAFAPHSIREDNGLSDFAMRLYHENQRFDEWPGENYEGSSVLGCAQALSHFGFLRRYEWCTTVDEVAMGLNIGPVVLGINWYDRMFEPDADGNIVVAGTLAGGHAICLGAQRGAGSKFRLDNSWGRELGVNGSAWITRDGLGRLLAEEGEAMVPHKVYPLPDLSQLT